MSRMIIRNPTSGEVARAAEVAAAAFPNLSLEHWHESFGTVARVFGERFVLVVEMDGRIVSTLLCCPAPVVVGGAEVTHSSVGAVATLPECRNQGCAGAMMTECVKLLRDEGIATSSLWPFSYAYYRKFGWEIGAESRAYSAQGRVFAELRDPSGVRGATDADMDRIALIYATLMEQHNCRTVRSNVWWSEITKLLGGMGMITEPGRGAVVHEENGVLDGYAVYELCADGDNRSIGVKEMVFGSGEARRAMLAKLGSIEPEGQLSWTAPADDTLLKEIPNPRVLQTTVNASFQFRVIDPEAALASLTPMLGDDQEFTFSIDDPIYKHGFEIGVRVEDDEVSICKPGRRNRLQMSVQTLARLFTGYLGVLDAWEMGLVRCDETETLAFASQLFSPLVPYRSWLDPG